MESNASHREPWNKGKLVGQKAPLKVRDFWALRVHLQIDKCMRKFAFLASAQQVAIAELLASGALVTRRCRARTQG